MNFVVEITSTPDRDDLVAEIWFGKAMVAEVQRISEADFRVEIYANESNKPWSFGLQKWIAVLEEARLRLG
jgi:hypothetical protein